jgi:hypothetical protein
MPVAESGRKGEVRFLGETDNDGAAIERMIKIVSLDHVSCSESVGPQHKNHFGRWSGTLLSQPVDKS